MNFYCYPIVRRLNSNLLEVNEDEFFVFRACFKNPWSYANKASTESTTLMNPNAYFVHSTDLSSRKKTGRSVARHSRSGFAGRSQKTDIAQECISPYPTDFCRLLKQNPPPIPPNLLRPQNGAPIVKKDPSSKLKIMLRIAPSSSGCNRSSEGSFLTVDSRKKQVALSEQHSGTNIPSCASFSGARTTVSKLFVFDSVFTADDSNTEICSTALTEAVHTVVSGSDACVLSFGYVPSGKFHLMPGHDSGASSIGIIPCAISWLYRTVNENRQRTGAKFSIRVSAVEIHGPDESLSDLLYEVESQSNTPHGAATTSVNICIQDDPIFGMQLQNFKELRAPTAEKAAHYLDAAIAKRRNTTEDERRNSHMFFTLHVYQYQVDKTGQGGVVGGRTKLHLVDLGSGEKNSKVGRSSLTLPALGNVLLTVLQGQKHLPFRDSKLTQLLKETVGSQACKSIAVVASASTDVEKYTEAVNVIQIAGRLFRIKGNHGRKIKMGTAGGNSSGGESSCDERSRKRRLTRSASDLDCTTSSSEQSNDTVIFLGANLSRTPAIQLTSGSSDRETDQESSQCTVLARPSTTKPDVFKPYSTPQQPSMGAILENLTLSQTELFLSPGFRSPMIRRNARDNLTGKLISSPKYQPPSLSVKGRSLERWVDGPKVEPRREESGEPLLGGQHTLEQTKKRSALPYLDPLKLQFIKQWVYTLEQERLKTATIRLTSDSRIDAEAMPSVKVPADSLSNPDLGECRFYSDMVDVGLQVDERDIDAEMLEKIHYTVTQDVAPNRFLEDIVEVEEENLSELKSSTATSSRMSLLSGRYKMDAELRNEGLAGPDLASIQSRPTSLQDFFGPDILNLGKDHPLRILSKECMDTKSDSISFSTDNLENVSLPNTDQLDEELSTDEELERAMRASLTSVRSHEILEKLKADNFPRELPSEAPNLQLSDLSRAKIFAESAELNKSKVTGTKNICEDNLVDESLQTAEPPMSKMSHTAIMSELIPYLVSPSHESRYQTDQTSQIISPEQINIDTTSKSLTPPKRPSKLPTVPHGVVSDAARPTCQQQPPIMKNKQSILTKMFKHPRSVTHASADPNQKNRPEAAPTALSKLHTVPQVHRSDGSKTLEGQIEPSAKKSNAETAILPTASPAIKKPSILMKFLKSPTKLKKPLVAPKTQPTTSGNGVNAAQTLPVSSPITKIIKSQTPSNKQISAGKNRNSIGYDSGHDSGIVMIAPESPEDHVARSPYSKITKPRSGGGHWSSSGHGSDNSSAVSSDVGTSNNIYGIYCKLVKGPLATIDSKHQQQKMKLNNGQTYSSVVKTKLCDTNQTVKSGGGQQDKHEPWKNKWLESASRNIAVKHHDPTKIPSRVRDDLESDAFQEKMFKKEVTELLDKQKFLKEELRKAKERLGTTALKWSYDLHVSEHDCLLDDADYVEALKQETNILEKRVAACKSHVMLITVFDSGVRPD